ncbi:hypothetical protein BRC65_05250 [Halobacteriales archaeon QH_2_65_14]|nr:MAG: hypothetical protein BRC65_05250 [Halobacteriales archaeon QH_2_65_14]
MERLSRRRYAALLGTTATLTLAGCLDDDDEQELFLVTNTKYRIEEPDGILVQVTIENFKSERRSARLDITLIYDPDDGEGREWHRTDEVSVGRGSSPRYNYVFEGAYEAGYDLGDYTVEAELTET